MTTQADFRNHPHIRALLPANPTLPVRAWTWRDSKTREVQTYYHLAVGDARTACGCRCISDGWLPRERRHPRDVNCWQCRNAMSMARPMTDAEIEAEARAYDERGYRAALDQRSVEPESLLPEADLPSPD